MYIHRISNTTKLKAQLHGSNFGANSNLIGWVNVIGAARALALALASIMMSFAKFNVFGLGYGVHYLGIRFNDARVSSVSGSARRGARPGAGRKKIG